METKIKLHHFLTPDYVVPVQTESKRQDGYKEAPKYMLSEIDAATLDLLCEQFREDVFKKAGKKDPNIR